MQEANEDGGMSRGAVVVASVPSGPRGGGVSDSKSSSGGSVAKQLNKLKSFLGTLQSYHDSSEEETTIRSRRKRIDLLIDSLVSHAIQVDQFFRELQATGYPITESEIVALQPIVQNALPMLNAEIRSTLSERGFSEHHAADDVAGAGVPSRDRRHGERHRAEMGSEPHAKRPYQVDISANGQLSKAELHDNLQGMFYQVQMMLEQMGQTIYALRVRDANQVVLPATEIIHHGQPTLISPPFEMQAPRHAAVTSKGTSPPGSRHTQSAAPGARGSYHYSSPVNSGHGHHPNQHDMPAKATNSLGVVSSSPVISTTSSRRESGKGGKHRDETPSKKHRGSGAPSESCWSCGAPASETCSRCKKARYCGQVCQRLDWNEKHHRDCKTPPVNGSSKKMPKSP